MINYVCRFLLIFIFIILFLSFKNQSKIIENDLIFLKKNYHKESQIYIDKVILLTKQINQLQLDEFNNYNYVENKKIIKFNRNKFDHFTIIKVNYVQSE